MAQGNTERRNKRKDKKRDKKKYPYKKGGRGRSMNVSKVPPKKKK